MNATTLLIFRPGQPRHEQQVDMPAELGLDAIKAVVLPYLEGQRLEHVAVLYDGRRADMFVGDESADGSWRRNEEATAIYRANWLARHPQDNPESMPAVYGPAVLFPDIIVWR